MQASVDSLNVLGLVPARGGSKGLPRKNLRPLAGLPLVAHSIRHSLGARLITRTVCSTDDPEIAAAARQHGAEVPFMRPADLASDTSTDTDYSRHAVVWLRDNDGWLADVVVILWPTCPARRSADIDGAVQTLLDQPDADAVVSVVAPAKSPYKMWRRTEAGFLVPLLTSSVFEQFAGPRQRLPEVLAPNGYVHVVRAETVLRYKSILGLRTLPYEMARGACIDIDSEEDFAAAETWLQSHGQ
jgi:N-acylneuraminate cytidylyltransferase